ncbi:MAG: homoserine kinase [Streptococcaceae bacterium]|jgi:homoserine kinase|nr:homoserine kinase [Streptococcaceae bacterium]
MMNFSAQGESAKLGFDDVLGEVEKKPAFFGTLSGRKIRVPATSANLGCGFDSLGLALTLYLTVEIGAVSDVWEVVHDFGAAIPSDATNLIVASALKLSNTLLPHILYVTSDIPLEHGLGSSSSAIVAGIELANLLAQLRLTTDEKLRLACAFEGHPDNVAPALLGGLIVASYNAESLTHQTLPAPTCALIVVVPPYNVSTKKARDVLPETYSRAHAAIASANANVLVASLAKGDLTLAGRLMEQDLFHETYRAALIPDLKKVRAIAHDNAAYGTYLSGAGSTIMTLTSADKAPQLLSALTKHYTDVRQLAVDTAGATTY